MRQAREKEARRATLPRLIGLLRPEWPRLTVVIALGILSVGFLAAGPQILGNATNILFDGITSSRLPAGTTKAQAIAALRARHSTQLAHMFGAMHIVPGTGVNFTRLGQVLGLAALVYLLSAVLSWALAFIMAGTAVRTVYRLRQAIDEKLGRLPLQYFDSHPHGDILSRVANDTDNVFTTLQEGLSPLLTSVLTVVGIMGMMFWISPLLSALTLGTISLAVVVASLIARRSKERFAAQWKWTGRLNGLVEETHTGHSLVLAFNQRQPMIKEFERQNEKLYDTSFRAQFISGVILPAIQFVGNLNYVLVAALGGYQVVAGVISLGALQAFIQYSRRFVAPIAQIGGQMNILQSGMASIERVFEFLELPEDAMEAGPSEGPAPDVARGAPSVRLNQVCFRYDPAKPLIEDFTLEVDAGQTVAIVGHTGAGKTTIVNLLMRFYEIDSGSILLDGVDYRDLARDQVRRNFGMVLQDTWLFDGTIRDNIAYGREGASDEEIVGAARAAYADDFIRTLPDGYATVLDGDASGISAGQKQLLTIARAFLADPGILILDEATSNVDTRTEVLIQDAMARLRIGRTSFVIAHRLSTIRNADTIIVMDSGRIAEQGKHDELLSRQGMYRELYQSQFSGALAS